MRNFANPLAPKRAVPDKTAQIKAWVRELLALDDSVTVSVAEVACPDEGCPDVETVIGILKPGKGADKIRIPKPIAELQIEDFQ